MSTTKIVENQDGDNMLIMTESHDKKPGKLTGEGSRKPLQSGFPKNWRLP
jgi:hypothetical protein